MNCKKKKNKKNKNVNIYVLFKRVVMTYYKPGITEKGREISLIMCFLYGMIRLRAVTVNANPAQTTSATYTYKKKNESD